MLVAFQFWAGRHRQVVLAGDPALSEFWELASVAQAGFSPDQVILHGDPDRWPAVNGKPAAYVCENFICQQPVTTAAELAELLK